MATRAGASLRSSPAKPQSPGVARVNTSDAVILSKSEFERIKAASKPVTPQQIQAQKRSIEEAHAAQMAASRARKERMLQMEAERARNAPLSDIQQDEKKKSEEILQNASNVLLEERDEVKKMNEMVHYARCATIREKQLDEKIQAREEVKQEDRAWAMLMEADRARALAIQEEEARQKIEKRQADALVLRQQIHDRETQRLREQEQLEHERDVMMKRIEEENRAAAQKEEARRIVGRKLLEEGAQANRQAAEAKEREKLHAKLEDLKIVQYVKEKEARDREYEEEQKRIKAEKELETCRLRAMQEKAIDKQAIRDALLARRAQEKYEREWREKEKAEAEKLAAMQADLARAREAQIRSREIAFVESAQLEKVEFERVLAIQRQKAEEEERAAREAEEKARVHAESVRRQIETSREQFERERAAKFAEGEVIRRKLAAEKEAVERAREAKLQQLRAQGIPEKYCAELARAKF